MIWRVYEFESGWLLGMENAINALRWHRISAANELDFFWDSAESEIQLIGVGSESDRAHRIKINW